MTYSLPVPTGGYPATAIDRALIRLGPFVGDIGVDVEHDTGCPSVGLDGEVGTAACTCEIVRLILPELGEAIA